MEDFQGNLRCVYDTLRVDACHYTCLKVHTMNSKSELSCELGTFGDKDMSKVGLSMATNMSICCKMLIMGNL